MFVDGSSNSFSGETSPVLPFDSEQERVDALSEAKKRVSEGIAMCDKRAVFLAPSARKKYMSEVHDRKQKIMNELIELSINGYSGRELLERADLVIQVLKTGILFHTQNQETSMHQRESRNREHLAINKDLENLSLPPPPPLPSSASGTFTWHQFPHIEQLTRCLNNQFDHMPGIVDMGITEAVAARFANTISSRREVTEGLQEELVSLNQTYHLRTAELVGAAISLEHALPHCSSTFGESAD